MTIKMNNPKDLDCPLCRAPHHLGYSCAEAAKTRQSVQHKHTAQHVSQGIQQVVQEVIQSIFYIFVTTAILMVGVWLLLRIYMRLFHNSW